MTSLITSHDAMGAPEILCLVESPKASFERSPHVLAHPRTLKPSQTQSYLKL